jgi:hypothetical protein
MVHNNIKASLVVYANIEGLGWRRGTLVQAKNRKIKQGVMLYNGQEVGAPKGVYQIRTYEGSKAVYTPVGTDLEKAQAMLASLLDHREDAARRERLKMPERAKPVAKEKTPAELVHEYIAAKSSPSLELSDTSIRHYKDSLIPFLATVSTVKVEYPSDVTQEHIIAYMDALKKDAYSQKTRAMRYGTVRGFLRSQGIVVEKLIDSSIHKRFAAKGETSRPSHSRRTPIRHSYMQRAMQLLQLSVMTRVRIKTCCLSCLPASTPIHRG